MGSRVSRSTSSGSQQASKSPGSSLAVTKLPLSHTRRQPAASKRSTASANPSRRRRRRAFQPSAPRPLPRTPHAHLLAIDRSQGRTPAFPHHNNIIVDRCAGAFGGSASSTVPRKEFRARRAEVFDRQLRWCADIGGATSVPASPAPATVSETVRVSRVLHSHSKVPMLLQELVSLRRRSPPIPRIATSRQHDLQGLSLRGAAVRVALLKWL